jgi:hypothetical protein
MKVMIALASEFADALPKGAKINSFEVHHVGSPRMLGRDKAGTMKQIFKRLDFIVNAGMKFDLTVIAEHEGAVVKVKDTYVMKSTGPVKV